MWPFPVTVIYEEQKYYNIPAANQRNGSKRGGGSKASMSGKGAHLIQAKTREENASYNNKCKTHAAPDLQSAPAHHSCRHLHIMYTLMLSPTNKVITPWDV